VPFPNAGSLAADRNPYADAAAPYKVDRVQASGKFPEPLLNTPKTITDDPQFRHRFHWYPAEQTVAETLDFPVHVAGEGPVDVVRAPDPGEHTEDVLTSVLGYAPDRIAALRDTGVFGDD